MVTLMLQMAKVKPTGIVYDRGAGEGRIPLAAARAFGARGSASSMRPKSPLWRGATSGAPASRGG
ncbi:MAG: hypothetical protein JNN21_13645 [Candidatus Accumulibacter sp.]|uniref:hypothetical protein n=1 Tax=Accumulibacter sp. TaxID=2053492 RepID=UPI001A580F80|nr:hypothetical protein [Accumulibacter sp.]MBL8392895.1 hypothetical protein [Accumulibacter sp.]HRD90292.1 hypothetical protein [Accumulibacter sp.]